MQTSPVTSNIRLTRKLGSNLGFCKGGIADFIARSGIKPGRLGITADEFAAQWKDLPERQRMALAAEYGQYLGLVARALDLDVKAWLDFATANPFEGLTLGSEVGKPEYVSGKTAYEQRYERGTLCWSYRTVVGAIIDGRSYRTVHRYSVTTSKHMGRFGLGINAIPVTEKQLRDLYMAR